MGNRKSKAFTLVELLIVIGILAVLISILVPVIGKIRTASYETGTKALISQLDQACQAYYSEYRAYPGPLSNGYLDATDQGAALSWLKPDGTKGGSLGATATAAGTGVTVGAGRVTASENLVLGLCGGMLRQTAGGNATFAVQMTDVGQGPRVLNPVRPARHAPFIESSRALSTYDESRGLIHFEQDPTSPLPAAQASLDSRIPEFIDSFPDAMPVLYMRARSGATNLVSIAPNDDQAQYNLVEIAPYTNSNIGTGRTIKPGQFVGSANSPTQPHGLHTVDPTKYTNKGWASAYQYPYDGYDYLIDPASYARTAANPPAANATRQVRRKDAYVLIAPGRDRVYGTEDDITNFGSVLP